jgi:hypothetical protein
MHHAANFFSASLASLVHFSKNAIFAENQCNQDDPLAPWDFHRGERHKIGNAYSGISSVLHDTTKSFSASLASLVHFSGNCDLDKLEYDF